MLNLNRNIRKALCDYVFLRVVITEKYDTEDKYVKLVVDLAAGEPVNSHLLCLEIIMPGTG
jgi:hypothetical protein